LGMISCLGIMPLVDSQLSIDGIRSNKSKIFAIATFAFE